MMRQRKFVSNIYGVSVMYDAVLFIVMVSISGAVLLPALQNNIAIESSLDTHREEIVDETLLMLMTARVDTFEYVFAGSQIENILGDLYDEDTLIYSITKNVLHLLCNMPISSGRLTPCSDPIPKIIKGKWFRQNSLHLSMMLQGSSLMASSSSMKILMP